VSEPATDFDAIESPHKDSTWRGATLRLEPVKVGKFPAFARALRPILGILTSAGPVDFAAVIGDHGDSVIEAVSIATGIPRAELDTANLDEFMVLVADVIEVNRDFFTRRLAGQVTALASQATAATTSLGRGSTPSKS
jgi:hypothetical protein